MQTTTIKVSSQGQITIPKEWRETLGVKPGETIVAKLKIWLENKALILTPKPDSWVDSVAGTAKGAWGKNSEDYIKEERQNWNK